MNKFFQAAAKSRRRLKGNLKTSASAAAAHINLIINSIPFNSFQDDVNSAHNGFRLVIYSSVCFDTIHTRAALINLRLRIRVPDFSDKQLMSMISLPPESLQV